MEIVKGCKSELFFPLEIWVFNIYEDITASTSLILFLFANLNYYIKLMILINVTFLVYVFLFILQLFIKYILWAKACAGSWVLENE